MTLQQKQFEFPKRLVRLFNFAWSQGYQITGGEWWRSDETAQLNAQEGKGIAKSNHRLRIAEDICAFRFDGVSWVYLTGSDDYRELGLYWKSLSTPDCQCYWGGDFKKPDGCHFSFDWNGIK